MVIFVNIYEWELNSTKRYLFRVVHLLRDVNSIISNDPSIELTKNLEFSMSML